MMHKRSGRDGERQNWLTMRTMAWGLVVLLILAFCPAPLASSAEPPPESAIAEVAEGAAMPGRKSKKRRRQRAAKKRRARVARLNAPTEPAAEVPVYGQIQFRGAFSVQLGDTNLVHGEGKMVVKLDQTTVENLAEGLQVIQRIPEMLESTSEILERLSDPQTQQQLQQVEQLLRLLPQAEESS